MKKCPFCAEEIQEDAVKCRFCGEFLQDNLRKIAGQKPQWYFKTSTTVIGFLLVGPFIIPLVWFNPRYSIFKKIALTVFLAAISVALFLILRSSVASISEYYDVIQGNY